MTNSLDSVPTPSSSDDIESFGERVYEYIRNDAVSVGLNIPAPVWILMRRGCYWYAMSVMDGSPHADRMLLTMMAEPVRYMRSSQSFMTRMEARLAAVINELFPDPVTRARAVQKLLLMSGEDD